MNPGRDYIGVGVFGLVFNEKGQILLANHKPSKKKSSKFANKWSMPGGAVEFMEDPKDALKREMIEELNLEVSELAPINYYSNIEPDRHWIALNFTAKTLGMPKIMEPEKIGEAKFFNIRSIPVNITEDTRNCLVQLGLLKESIEIQ